MPLDLQTQSEKFGDGRNNDLLMVGYLENSEVSNTSPQMDYNLQNLRINLFFYKFCKL